MVDYLNTALTLYPPTPVNAYIIDSQSVKTSGGADNRGIDGGKKIKGRKLHILTETKGHLLYVQVHAANIPDTVAGCQLFEEALKIYPSIKGVCADAGYRKTMERFVREALKRTVEIVTRTSPGWAVMAKRWVVERTFAWLNFCRRLSKDYEIRSKCAETWVILAHSRILLARLCNP